MARTTKISYDSDSSPKKRVAKSATARALSASEIARNPAHFETWSSYQGCEIAAYSDLPQELAQIVTDVLNLSSRLPRAWADPTSAYYQSMQSSCSPGFLGLFAEAYKSCPGMFSDDIDATEASSLRLFDDLRCVYIAHERLLRLQSSEGAVSEASMVANVYEVIRSSAASTSSYRAKCSITLAQPLERLSITTDSLRILSAATVIPDAALFVPSLSIRDLSHSTTSAFKTLKRSPRTGKPATFAAQATPCTQLPALPAFEFIASVWEDKKPTQTAVEDAYRQNRMSTTAAVRHLHAMHIHAPVFGLTWADGVVRAHVDWATGDWDTSPAVHSAPYPGVDISNDVHLFREWHLKKPADAIAVFLLVRNIDTYASGVLVQRVRDGVERLADSVVQQRVPFRAWKRVGKLNVTPLREKKVLRNSNSGDSAKENTTEQSSVEPPPVKRTKRTTRRRRSSPRSSFSPA
ncbi:hypothetical protein PENSPDRAFT_597469 [Peniophora sp. CONT]|nr:hypothetical protein PENSPDRAFT_597469 [Peniophora sp. CONT]